MLGELASLDEASLEKGDRLGVVAPVEFEGLSRCSPLTLVVC